MTSERISERRKAAPDRRPAPAAQPPVAAPTTIQALHRRLGHQGVVALAQRQAALRALPGGPEAPSAPTPGAVRVSSPSDPAEREAARVAAAVVRSPSPPVAAAAVPVVRRAGPAAAHSGSSTPPAAAEPLVMARAAPSILTRASVACDSDGGKRRGDTEEKPAQRQEPRGEVQRAVAAAPPPAPITPIAADRLPRLGSGVPLPAPVRRFMEPRFGADFSGVRIHTDGVAARLSHQLGAEAFTIGNAIAFGRDRFQPDSETGRELIAHELAHTIQQGAVRQREPKATPAPAAIAPTTLQRRSLVAITERTPPLVQRLGFDDALAKIAGYAAAIPGFRMLTIILGTNPITMQPVERSAANILRAIVEFIPGGLLIVRALETHGAFDRAGAFVERQIVALGLSAQAVGQAITVFVDSLSWKERAEALIGIGDAWERGKRILLAPIERVKARARTIADTVLDFVKDAILRPLAGLAARTPGWDLLCAVLGNNPITGDAVPRTAETLIGGFMTLIGQQDVWENTKKANAVGRAWGWFQGALTGVVDFVRQIPALALAAVRSLEPADLLQLPLAYVKVGRAFIGFLGRFASWAGTAVWTLLEIVVDAVSPGALVHIRKTGAALKGILKNPLPFVGNLAKAAKQGFLDFGGNFVGHLKAGLLEWLTGSLTGVHTPQSFALAEIVRFVLSVLNVTWQAVRGKLVRVVGEPAVKALETGFDIVVTLVRDGPAAAWEKIKDQLAGLRDTVLGGIIELVVDAVVKRAIPKLVALFIPGAGFVSAIVSIYEMVQVFIAKLARMASVVGAFLQSITAIAAGAIGTAATRVETALAGLLALAISFLAGFAGLGKISDKVIDVLNKVRAPIDRALDALVTWIVGMAKKAGRLAIQVGAPQDPKERVRLAAAASIAAARRLSGRVTRALLDPVLSAIKLRYGLTELHPYERQGTWWVRLRASPGADHNTGVATAGPVEAQELPKIIREIADQEFRKLPSPKATGAGTHDEPFEVRQSDIASQARHLETLRLTTGRIAVYDQSTSGVAESRGVIQKTLTEYYAYGATESRRRVRLGPYTDIGDMLSQRTPKAERDAARELREFLSGGGTPMTLSPGWAGGLKTLLALEVRRDPVALATLPMNLRLVEEGKRSMKDVFGKEEAKAQFSHAQRKALAPLRGVRTEEGLPVAQGSLGSKAQRQSIREADMNSVIAYVETMLKDRLRQDRDVIRVLVTDAIHLIIRPGASSATVSETAAAPAAAATRPPVTTEA